MPLVWDMYSWAWKNLDLVNFENNNAGDDILKTNELGMSEYPSLTQKKKLSECLTVLKKNAWKRKIA